MANTRYLPIDSALFIETRKRFISKLKSNSLAVFNSNDIMPTNADGNMAFRQNNDLFYLSGVDQEESILLLFPDCKDEKYKEVLFLRETNEDIAIWHGAKLTKEQALRLKKDRWLMLRRKRDLTPMQECMLDGWIDNLT